MNSTDAFNKTTQINKDIKRFMDTSMRVDGWNPGLTPYDRQRILKKREDRKETMAKIAESYEFLKDNKTYGKAVSRA